MTRLTHHSRAMIACLAAALSIAGASSLSAQAAARAQGDLEAELSEDAPPSGEQRLAALLDGRIAGKPADCILARPSQKMQTIDGTAYVFGAGETIYVQRTRHPEQIRNYNALVSDRRSTTHLCRMDLTRTVDRYTGRFVGAVFFEDFVPYTRVKAAAAAATGR